MSSRIIVQLESQRHQRPPPPGDESYGPTVNMFSFTSAILRQNVPSIWLDAHKRCKALPRSDIQATSTP
ncbi:TPA: hypothetical protein ACH3X2_001552 [Trebouxia sp. C0005]